MRIGILVIGDELLLGKRQDKHLPKMIEILDTLGVRHEPGAGAGVP